MFVYKVKENSYVTKILSEQLISIDYLDKETIQSFNDFKEFSNPSISYKTNDFLILVDKSWEELKQNKNIELSSTKRFGWYYEKVHKSEIQIFSATNSKKLDNLFEINPSLVIDSFDKCRDFYKTIKATNVLVGAFGLCYYTFKDDYDKFFRKIRVYKDRWIINKNDLDKTDYPILLQLFLFYNSQSNELNNKLFNADEFKGIRILGFYLEKAMNYFIHKNYTMNGFLEFMEESFKSDDEDISFFQNEFNSLNNLYVKKGLDFESKNSLIKATKDFLSIAKSESVNIKESLSKNGFSKTAIFLLGMLNLGDRIDEQFNFSNFAPSIVNLTLKEIVEISSTDNEIIISFNQREVNRDRNNKFTYIKNYFDELHSIKELTDNIADLNKRTDLLSKVYDYSTSIEELENTINEFKSKNDGLTLQKDELQNMIKESESTKKLYEEFINVCNDKNQLQKLINHIKEEIKDLHDEEKQLKKQLEERKTSNINIKAKLDQSKINTNDERKKKKSNTPKNKKDFAKKNESLPIENSNLTKKSI